MDTIRNFDELIAHLKQSGNKKRVAVVRPNDESTCKAVEMAERAGFIEPTAITGDNPDEAAARAVAMAREGKADVIMKGQVNTDNLLRAVLNKETGILPKGRVLTHVTCAQLPVYDKLIFCTDVAVIPHPTAEQREEQLKYMLSLMRYFGIEEPRRR